MTVHTPGTSWAQESIYATSECSATEILYEGSDDESYASPDQRRQAYVEAAYRFLHGQVPVLASASLRGPFDRESGWTNPWRSQKSVTQPVKQPLEPRKTPERFASPRKASGSRRKSRSKTREDQECHLPSPESLKQASPTPMSCTHKVGGFARSETVQKARYVETETGHGGTTEITPKRKQPLTQPNTAHSSRKRRRTRDESIPLLADLKAKKRPVRHLQNSDEIYFEDIRKPTNKYTPERNYYSSPIKRRSAVRLEDRRLLDHLAKTLPLVTATATSKAPVKRSPSIQHAHQAVEKMGDQPYQPTGLITRASPKLIKNGDLAAADMSSCGEEIDASGWHASKKSYGETPAHLKSDPRTGNYGREDHAAMSNPTHQSGIAPSRTSPTPDSNHDTDSPANPMELAQKKEESTDGPVAVADKDQEDVTVSQDPSAQSAPVAAPTKPARLQDLVAAVQPSGLQTGLADNSNIDHQDAESQPLVPAPDVRSNDRPASTEDASQDSELNCPSLVEEVTLATSLQDEEAKTVTPFSTSAPIIPDIPEPTFVSDEEPPSISTESTKESLAENVNAAHVAKPYAEEAASLVPHDHSEVVMSTIDQCFPNDYTSLSPCSHSPGSQGRALGTSAPDAALMQATEHHSAQPQCDDEASELMSTVQDTNFNVRCLRDLPVKQASNIAGPQRPRTPEPDFSIKSMSFFMSPSPRRPIRQPFATLQIDGRFSSAKAPIKSALKYRGASEAAHNNRVSWGPSLHEPTTPEMRPDLTDQRARHSSPPPESLLSLQTSPPSKFGRHFSAVTKLGSHLPKRLDRSPFELPGTDNAEIASVLEGMHASSPLRQEALSSRQVVDVHLDEQEADDIVESVLQDLDDILKPWDMELGTI